MEPTRTTLATAEPVPEFRFVRRHLLFTLALITLVVAGSAYAVGLGARAPAAAAAVILLLAALAEGVRAFVRRGRSWLWRVSHKLALLYVLLGIVPAVLLGCFFALLGYLLTGQYMAYLTLNRLEEVRREMEAMSWDLASRLSRVAVRQGSVEALRTSDDLPQVAPSLRPLTGPEEAARFAGAFAHAVIRWRDTDVRFVPSGFDWPEGELAQHPPWIGLDSSISRVVVQPSGPLALLAATRLERSGLEVYVELGVPLDDDALAYLRGLGGADIRIVATAGGQIETIADSGRVPSGDGLWSLPILGILSLEPVEWASGVPDRASRLVVIERSIGDLWEALFELKSASGLLLLSVLAVLLVAFIAFQLASLSIGFVLAKSITVAVQELTEGARRIERGDLEHRVEPRSEDQIGALALSFNTMAQSVKRLFRESAERERLEEELRIGRRIQQSLLPEAAWTDGRWELAALSVPAKEVGGDYYDFFDLAGERLGLLIADVSGKGTEAAFYMAEVKGIMLALTRTTLAPERVLAEADVLLGKSLDRRTFVTMAYAVLDRATGRFDFARAGHNPVLHLAVGAATVASHCPPGLSLGLDRTGRFGSLMSPQTLQLQCGDLVALVTDGVTEMASPDGELYGQERLEQMIIRHRQASAAAIKEAVMADLERFGGGLAAPDDVTLILLKRL